MDEHAAMQALAYYATHGTEQEKQEAIQTINRLQTRDLQAPPEETLGVDAYNATTVELNALGVPFHGGVLLMEIDIARVDQDKRDTLKAIEQKCPPKMCHRRLAQLRQKVLNHCRLERPLTPAFYHALLTLAYVRRNTKILRQPRGNRTADPIPACSHDREEDCFWDEYDLLDALDDCSYSVENVWNNLKTFYETLQLREHQSSGNDKNELDWCNSQDVEMREILLYLREELRVINPEEYRTTFHALQTGQVDMARMRAIWRSEQPHVLSILRAYQLLKLVNSEVRYAPGMTNTFYQEFVAVTNATIHLAQTLLDEDKKIADQVEIVEEHSGCNSSKTSSSTLTFKQAVDQYGDRMFPSYRLTHSKNIVDLVDQQLSISENVKEAQKQLYVALQTLWTACIRERSRGNQSKGLLNILSQCMIDRDTVLAMVRRANISLQVIAAVRYRWYCACTIAAQYASVWDHFDDLSDVRPGNGKRDLAFSLWTILRVPEKFYNETDRLNSMQLTPEEQARGGPKIFLNEEEAGERAFIVMRCIGRHGVTCKFLAEKFIEENISGPWDTPEQHQFARGKQYLRCIQEHERWLQGQHSTSRTQKVHDPEQYLEGVKLTRWAVRKEAIQHDEVAVEIHGLTQERREQCKLQWLTFAAFILQRESLKQVLRVSQFEMYLPLYKVFLQIYMDDETKARNTSSSSKES